mmetsp:Transcript_16464/g.43121  ORF Transcript_16464/g.43121 Transcript_16464/m.43121 type:complete len:258 (+) Transcript_16464:424-1197(+)
MVSAHGWASWVAHNSSRCKRGVVNSKVLRNHLLCIRHLSPHLRIVPLVVPHHQAVCLPCRLHHPSAGYQRCASSTWQAVNQYARPKGALSIVTLKIIFALSVITSKHARTKRRHSTRLHGLLICAGMHHDVPFTVRVAACGPEVICREFKYGFKLAELHHYPPIPLAASHDDLLGDGHLSSDQWVRFTRGAPRAVHAAKLDQAGERDQVLKKLSCAQQAADLPCRQRGAARRAAFHHDLGAMIYDMWWRSSMRRQRV